MTVGAGNTVTNNGAWSIGNQNVVATSAVTGNVLQSNSGRLLVDLDFANLSVDRLNVVGGNASLSGSIVLNRMNLETIRPGSRDYVIVSAASGVTSSGLAINVGSSAVTNYTLSTTAASGSAPGNLVLSVSTNFAPASASAALTENEQAVGNYFNSIATVGTPTALVPTINQVISQSDITKLAQLYDGLSSDTHLVSQVMPFYGSLRFSEALLSCRQLDGYYRFSSEGECAWMNLSPSRRTQDATTDRLTVTQDGMSIAAGFQRELTESWHVGFGASFDTASMESNRVYSSTLAERSRGQGGNFGVVAKGNYGANVLSVSATLGTMSYDSDRFATQGNSTVIAKSEQTVNLLAAHLRYGYAVEGKNWYLKPAVDAGYTSIKRGAFEETGLSATNLIVAKETNEIASLAPMVEVGGEVQLEAGARLRLFGRGGVTRILSGDAIDLTAAFAGAPTAATPFTVGQLLDKQTVDFTAGLDLIGSNGSVWRVSFSDSNSDTARAQAANLKFSFPF